MFKLDKWHKLITLRDLFRLFKTNFRPLHYRVHSTMLRQERVFGSPGTYVQTLQHHRLHHQWTLISDNDDYLPTNKKTEGAYVVTKGLRKGDALLRCHPAS